MGKDKEHVSVFPTQYVSIFSAHLPKVVVKKLAGHTKPPAFFDRLESIIENIYTNANDLNAGELRFIQEMVELSKISLNLQNTKRPSTQKLHELTLLDSLTQKINEIYSVKFDNEFQNALQKAVHIPAGTNTQLIPENPSTEVQSKIMERRDRKIYHQKIRALQKSIERFINLNQYEKLKHFPDLQEKLALLQEKAISTRNLLTTNPVNLEILNNEHDAIINIFHQISTQKLQHGANIIALSTNTKRKLYQCFGEKARLGESISNTTEAINKTERQLRDLENDRHSLKTDIKKKLKINNNLEDLISEKGSELFKMKMELKNFQMEQTGLERTIETIAMKHAKTRNEMTTIYQSLLKQFDSIKDNTLNLNNAHKALMNTKKFKGGNPDKFTEQNLLRNKQRRMKLIDSESQNRETQSEKPSKQYRKTLNKISNTIQSNIENIIRGGTSSPSAIMEINQFIDLLDRMSLAIKNHAEKTPAALHSLHSKECAHIEAQISLLKINLKKLQNIKQVSYSKSVKKLSAGKEQSYNERDNLFELLRECKTSFTTLVKSGLINTIANQMYLRYEPSDFSRDSYLKWHSRPDIFKKIDNILNDFHLNNNVSQLNTLNQYIDEALQGIYSGKINLNRMGALIKLKFEIDRLSSYLPLKSLPNKMSQLNDDYGILDGNSANEQQIQKSQKLNETPKSQDDTVLFSKRNIPPHTKTHKIAPEFSTSNASPKLPPKFKQK